MIKPGTLIYFLLLTYVVTAQQSELQQKSETGIFQNDSIIEATLTYDFRALNKAKESEEYQEAVFGIYLQDSTYIEKPVRIRARGRYRKAHCRHIPLRIDFSESGFDQEGWNELDKIKLVRCCKNSASYNQLVIREWLVYRMYNLFTDKSYKTCLLHLTMNDARESKKPFSSYAFILEETNKMAERMNSIEVELERVRAGEFENTLMNLVSVFEYMIGNLDWSATMMHNVKTFRPNGEGRQWHIPVPYDFDFSGVVYASYASPPPELGVESVRERLFRGFCKPKQEYVKIFKTFKDKEDEIYALIDECQYLNKANRKDMRIYIKQFYNVIDSEVQTQRCIFDQCR